MNKDFHGMLISLHDRWFNLTDTVAKHSAMFNLGIPRDYLSTDNWYEFKLEWANVNNNKTCYCNVFINGRKLDSKLALENKTLNGISCKHLSLPIDPNETANNVLIESIKTK